jgi:GAF domain-containing protein
MRSTRASGSSRRRDLRNQGVKLGDQLISVNGQAVHSTVDVQHILGSFQPDDQIPVTVRSPDGVQKTYTVTLSSFPFQDRITYYIIPISLSLIFLVISIWIFAIRRRETAGRAFALFASSFSIGAGSLFDLYTTHTLTYFWTLGLAMAGGALVDLVLAFPQEASFIARRSYLRWAGYVISLILCGYAYTTLFDFAQPTHYIPAWQHLYIFVGLSGLTYILFNAYYSFAAPSPVIKAQARMILTGAVVALGPLTIWFLATLFRPINFSTYLLIPIIFFPLTLGYAILRFRFLRMDDWLHQGVIYVLLTILIVGGYALLVSGLSLVFKAAMPASNPIWVVGLVFVIAIFLEPLRVQVQNIVDAAFFRGQRAYAENIQIFTRDLNTALDVNSIGRILRRQITATLGPDRLHIYVYDPLNDQYISLPDENGHPSTDIRFSASGALAQYFGSERLPLYLDETSLPENLKLEQTRLALLGARLFIALSGEGKPTGWLALGARFIGEPYTPRDLSFLENLCDQSSVAIQRIQTVANLEQRVQEMNALTRVSQGVNVTLTFDDVLELIYAQTAQIIPTSHLHITLHNQTNNYFYYGFCVENGDRLTNRENIPYPPNTGLNPEIIRRGRPILTQDYLHECQARNTAPEMEGVFAWMGVPLNAGADSIGALSVGSHDAGIVYTRSQLNLLQAIADQTAGAIVKSRLLHETQQRARQLGTLNDVTRQLTSTLEIEPLLQNILDSAVTILNCEAGSLFLVDEQTKELIFTVTVGPVAKDLLGQRMPHGSGIVGRAVTTRGPVIENDVKRSTATGWSTNEDEKTGFVTQALMAVPLQIKDNVMGVIEVINRRDGLPFVDEDQALLTAFAGQAAVALENARLYTLTDQKLADRVEELSVMQRIDRELNASLELDRAMRITLEWAMRQSGADAGLIGMIEEGKLHIVAQQGYEESLAGFQNQVNAVDAASPENSR